VLALVLLASWKGLPVSTTHVTTGGIFGIGIVHASLTGVQGSLLTEQFGTSTRTSGASLGYQIAAAIGGVLFLAVAAYEVPSIMKMMNKKPPPAVASRRTSPSSYA